MMSNNIEIIPSSGIQGATIGKCSNFLYERLSQSGRFDSFDLCKSRMKALKIIEKAGPLGCPNKNILVSGYVQSGKTLSMEQVMALGKDKGYGLIIILTGVTTVLNEQTKDRFSNDFKEEMYGDSYFKMHDAGKIRSSDEFQSTISNWKRDETKPIPVIFSKKNYRNLHKINELLIEIRGISGIPALIIADEADHYEIPRRGTGEAGRPFSIHNSINLLRDIFNKLSYVMYTATPAANIAISSENRMEAHDAVVLPSGFGYMGGSTFFPVDDQDETNTFCEIIDEFNINDDLTDAPDSLKKALKYFFVCMGSHYIRFKEKFYGENLDDDALHLTMMVHVHTRTAPMSSYVRHIKTLIKGYIDIQKYGNDESFKATFIDAYEELGKRLGHYSGKELEDFDSVINGIKFILDGEYWHVGKFAGGDDDEMVTNEDMEDWWSRKPNHIVVGGQKLDRGFTVKNLTVSYIPRPSSDNESTDLQQARWYGYHRHYIGYIKLFMSERRKNFYTEYIQIEEYVRCLLTEVEDGKRDIREALDLPVLPGYTSAGRGRDFKAYTNITLTDDKWMNVKRPITDETICNENVTTIDSFLKPYDSHFTPIDKTYAVTEDTDHYICEIPYKAFVNTLLNSYKFALPDSRKNFKAILETGYETHLSNNKDFDTCYVIKMGNLKQKVRSIATNGQISGFQQGATTSRNYPGDREIWKKDKITFQIFKFNINGLISYYLAYHLPAGINISVERADD